jgi:hypothetical protein
MVAALYLCGMKARSGASKQIASYAIRHIRATRCLEHIRDVMPAFRGEQGDRKKDPPSARLWTALREIDCYLT